MNDDNRDTIQMTYHHHNTEERNCQRLLDIIISQTKTFQLHSEITSDPMVLCWTQSFH